MSSKLIDHLKSLHTASVDAENGYRRALEDADKSEDLRSLFRKLMLIHRSHAEELFEILADYHELVDEKGSFMSTIHRAIMDIRAIFGGLGESVLSGLIDGELRNVSYYDEAIGLADGQSTVATSLRSQRNDLTETIAEMQNKALQVNQRSPPEVAQAQTSGPVAQGVRKVVQDHLTIESRRKELRDK